MEPPLAAAAAALEALPGDIVKPPPDSSGHQILSIPQDSGSAFSSLESLAEMAVCPVHCGRLDRPKLLPCGHVFCVSCLDKWSERQGGKQVECPMCRRRIAWPDGGAERLPNSRAHQAILDYLVTHAAKRAPAQRKEKQQPQLLQQPGDPPPQEEQPQRIKRKRSLEMRQELLTQLSSDLVRRADTLAPEAFDRVELTGVRDNLSRVLQRLESATAAAGAGGTGGGEAVEAASDNDDEEDTEEEADAAVAAAAAAAAVADTFSATQREMHRLSRYRVRQLPVAGDEPIAGAGLLRPPANGRARRAAPTLVLLGEGSRRLLIQRGGLGGGRRDHRRSLAPLSIDRQLLSGESSDGSGLRLRVASVQAARGAVYLTGWIGCRSVLAIVSPEAADGSGDVSSVQRYHIREEASEAAAARGFAGFHVEPIGPATVVAAQPGRQRVEFFAEDLRPTGHWLVFDRLTPRHVAWARESETLWVSCPDERLVLAVNDRTGVFRKLSTADIFQSPPAHIVAGRTPDGDCRVVLADSEQGRLYWIRKRRKYIFLQRLQLPLQLPGITSLAAMENGQLLVTSRERLFQLKPAAQPASASQRQILRCQLL